MCVCVCIYLILYITQREFTKSSFCPTGRERVNSDHLRHVTKADLWRLWQDSERQLRTRLRHAESQRDDLIRQMSRLGPRDRQGSASECHTVPEEVHVRDKKGRSPLKRCGEDATRGLLMHETEPTLHSVADRREEEDGDGNTHRVRLSEDKRSRPGEEILRKKRSDDTSCTPRTRKRHRLKHKDSLHSTPLHFSDPMRTAELEERFSQKRYSSRGSHLDGLESRRSSEDLDVTPRRRSKRTRSIDNLGVREPPEGFGGYSSTPLPLLHSLHQHTRTSSERSYGPLPPLDTREHRTSSRDQLGQPSGGEMIEKDADIILQDDDSYKTLDHRRRREEGAGPRRRRITSHPEGHNRRRSKDRHTPRDLSEGRVWREQEREPRYSGVRRSRERDVRDANGGTFSGMTHGTHKQHGARRRLSYGSSSEFEDTRHKTDTSTSTEMIPERRQQPMQQQHPVVSLRGYEVLRTGSEVSDERSLRETREAADPP